MPFRECIVTDSHFLSLRLLLDGTIVASVVAERYPGRIAGLILLGLIYKTTGVSLDEALAEAAKAPAGYAFTTEEERPKSRPLTRSHRFTPCCLR
jgi:pimeloyl-ACP methyl ester carboxylesterase